MRKIYALCTAVLAMFAINAHADRILYTENYEDGQVPSTWSLSTARGTLSVAGDSEGKYLSWALGQNNGTSATGFWGESIYDDVRLGLEEYTVYVEFQLQALGTNQYNGEFAVFTGEGCASKGGQGTSFAGANSGVWADYANLTPNYLFAIAEDNTIKDATTWFVNGDSADVFNPVAGTWYALTLTVNAQTREVSYVFEDFDGTFNKTGSRTLAEDASIYCSGLFLMNARYQSVTNVDNVKVSIAGDYANKPVIALTGLNDSERTYTIKFMEGETLHVVATDGTETTVGYYDGEVPGSYVVTTTTSGTLKAYTTVGTMTSDEVSQEVVCEPIVLPSPTYAIISAAEGYQKTYQFTVDNSGVDMNPEIFMDFSFKSDNGTDDFVLNNQNNGVNVSIPSKGTLTVTTKALGYSNGTASIINDQEFEVKVEVDLQSLTAAKLTEMGFEKMDDLDSETTSGEANWTARKRFYFDIATGEKDEEGKDITNRTYVYGASAQGLTPIQRYRYLQSKLNEETAHSLFAPLYVWYGTTGVDKSYFESDGVTPLVDPAGNPGGTTNLQVKLGIGIVFSGQVNDAENYNPNSISYSPILINNAYMGVDGLTDDDFIVVYKITDYGSTSLHPVYPVGTTPEDGLAKYLASHLGDNSSVVKGTETFPLYRVQDALNRVVVLSPKGATGINEIFNEDQKVISDQNAPVYNLNGVRVNTLQKGIYIKQGKKFVVQ